MSDQKKPPHLQKSSSPTKKPKLEGHSRMSPLSSEATRIVLQKELDERNTQVEFLQETIARISKDLQLEKQKVLEVRKELEDLKGSIPLSDETRAQTLKNHKAILESLNASTKETTQKQYDALDTCHTSEEYHALSAKMTNYIASSSYAIWSLQKNILALTNNSPVTLGDLKEICMPVDDDKSKNTD